MTPDYSGGASGRNRTNAPQIKNLLLYQLSYGSIKAGYNAYPAQSQIVVNISAVL